MTSLVELGRTGERLNGHFETSSSFQIPGGARLISFPTQHLLGKINGPVGKFKPPVDALNTADRGGNPGMQCPDHRWIASGWSAQFVLA